MTKHYAESVLQCVVCIVDCVIYTSTRSSIPCIVYIVSCVMYTSKCTVQEYMHIYLQAPLGVDLFSMIKSFSSDKVSTVDFFQIYKGLETWNTLSLTYLMRISCKKKSNELSQLSNCKN